MTLQQAGGFIIREATEQDAKDIAEITRSAFVAYAQLAGLQTVDALSETIDDIVADIKSKIVLVAYLDDKVVGSVRVSVNDTEGYLSRYGVSTEYQNLGIGKALINMVDVKMRQLGIKRLQLHTGSKITPLIRFYYGRGFYIDSTSKDKGYIRALLVKDYD